MKAEYEEVLKATHVFFQTKGVGVKWKGGVFFFCVWVLLLNQCCIYFLGEGGETAEKWQLKSRPSLPVWGVFVGFFYTMLTNHLSPTKKKNWKMNVNTHPSLPTIVIVLEHAKLKR